MGKKIVARDIAALEANRILWDHREGLSSPTAQRRCDV